MCWSVAVLAACLQLSCGHVLELWNMFRRNVQTEPNYNESFFLSLENYSENASPVSEDKYPWAARVVHATRSPQPHVCSAACVERGILLTAARCLHSAKVAYTTVIYQSHRFPVRAFVLPSKSTKQAFDDLAFIVVEEAGFDGPWDSVDLFDATNRTDENFNWFAELPLPEDSTDHVVVGYATQKGFQSVILGDDQYQLTELEVVVNINICPKILIYNNLISGFHVPCYHSCSVRQSRNKDPKCSNYHGVEGSAVFNVKTKKLFGISTWGTYFAKHMLPVGFSVPNSKSFFEDYTCARRIKLDRGQLVIDGYYQALCEDIN